MVPLTIFLRLLQLIHPTRCFSTVMRFLTFCAKKLQLRCSLNMIFIFLSLQIITSTFVFQSSIHSVSVPFQGRAEKTPTLLASVIFYQIFYFLFDPIAYFFGARFSTKYLCSLLVFILPIAYFAFLEECNYVKFISNQTRKHKLNFLLLSWQEMFKVINKHLLISSVSSGCRFHFAKA